ncbi:MAG TPA: WD40 repeat domain-containing protein [Bryobacteraceae bacterium]
MPFTGIELNIPDASGRSDDPAGEDSISKEEIAVGLFDSASGKEIERETITDGGPITGAAFSPDGSMLAFGDGAEIHVWDIPKGHIFEPLAAHQDIIDTVAFAPDGRLVSSGWDDGVIVWDVFSQGHLGRQLTENGGGLLTFSPDGKTLASATQEGVILWDAQTGQPLHRYPSEFPNKKKEPMGVLSFNPQATMLALEGEAGAYLLRLNDASPSAPAEILGQTTALAFHPNGKAIAFGLKTGEVVLWDWSAQRESWRIPSNGRGAAAALAFEPRGKEMASAYSNGDIVFFDGSSGQPKGRSAGPASPKFHGLLRLN